ncbi:hypothetical protein B0H17DRAFT_1083120, partial [Mycena rosella]
SLQCNSVSHALSSSPRSLRARSPLRRFPRGLIGSPPPTCAANTGTLQCCDSTQATSNPVVQLLLGLLGIQVPGVLQNLLVGVTCSVQVVGGSCASQSACCVDNTFNGLVNLGCTNVNL